MAVRRLASHMYASHSLSTKVDEEEDKRPDKFDVEVESDNELDNRTCPICARIFYNKSNMKVHVKREHERKGRFVCEHCEKTFSAKISLKYHMIRLHSKGFEISCDKCQDKFSHPEEFLKHLRSSHKSIHFQLEHKCSACGLIVKGKQNLNQHVREVHEGEAHINTDKLKAELYPYKCDACTSRFKRSNDLKRHKQAVHEKVEFICESCGKKFLYKTNLKRHILKAH